MAWDASQDEEIGQSIDDIDPLELAVDADRQAFVVYSSMSLSMRNLRPSCVRSSTKS
jgi:hypothetical protein